MALTPNIPMVNLGNTYIQAMQLAWISNTSISVAAGQARDSTNVNDIVLGSLATINAAVNGLNGLDTGALAASTFYAVYVISSSTLSNNSAAGNYKAPGALLSLSATAPTLPNGYDMFRRVGYVLTDGSVHILAFRQTGSGLAREMWYDALISVLAGGAAATFAAVSLVTAVPAIGITKVSFNATITPTAAGDLAALRPTGSSSTNGYVIANGAVAGVAQKLTMLVPCSAAESVDYLVTGTLTLLVQNYQDNL